MKILSILFLSIFLSGCSLIPRVNFDTPGTTPQSTEKSTRTIKCKGDIVLDEFGRVKSCKDGFAQNEKLYNKQERSFTVKEKILNFVRNLSGSLFWVFIFLLIFAPGLIGWIISRVFNGASKALESTVRAVGKAKHGNGDYLEELKKEYKKNPEVQHLINKIRAKISAEE